MKHNIGSRWYNKVLFTLLLLNMPFVFGIGNYILPSLQGGSGGWSAFAQDVSVTVNPVQPVLPPQAGQYVDNPGKFFTVRLVNNTDEQQRLYMGMHIDMLYPDDQRMVATPTDNRHIPRQPIILEPRAAKVLNPVEMKILFTHYELTEIYIRGGLYNDYKRGIFGLMPEGQYRLYMHAYKWDPYLTTAVPLNLPDDGQCQFSICYTAQAPKFFSPQPAFSNDGLSMLSVAKVDKNLPQFSWMAPTLNCNPTLLSLTYDVKVVRLDALSPDEAIEKNPVVFQRNRLTTPTLTIPAPYVTKMMEDEKAVYAMQVTANSGYTGKNSLNFTLIENDGRSEVLLFRLIDPLKEQENKQQEEEGEGEGPDEKIKVSVNNGENDLEKSDSLYVFEQPTITKPQFPKNAGRKIFIGDDLDIEWREAWFSNGKGERQDTINFDYNYAIYKGDVSDDLENILKTKPIVSGSTKDEKKEEDKYKATIAWDKIAGKVLKGDYLVLRVEAKAKNCKSIRMLDDDKNVIDFAVVEHFDEDYACGANTADIANKKPLDKAPEKGTMLKISDWQLEIQSAKQDSKTKALSGTGFIHWKPAGYSLRLAVKFDKLMVNTENVVFDGTCTSYSQNEGSQDYSDQEAVDHLFSSMGLDSFWGDLQLPENVKNKVSDEAEDIAKRLELGKYYTRFKKTQDKFKAFSKGVLTDLYLPTSLPEEISKNLPKDFCMQIASVQVSPKACVMNIIGEYVLPKSDILDNDVLIFGCPRLCMNYDTFLPEDGVVSLLSNFKIKDPSSDYNMTFKAPTQPLRPSDGCFLEWEGGEFAGLGLHIAMTIPNLRRVVDGKVQDAPPILDMRTTIKTDWNDWVGRITMDQFQIEDVPDWTFTPGSTIVFDHSYKRNDDAMPGISALPETYNPSKVNPQVAGNWNAWQGLYIKEVSVEFPKWGVFGSDDKGVSIGAQNMVFDASGCTLDIAADRILEAKTGKCGGWEFDLDKATVCIVQNNFDKCQIDGRFAIPLFGAKESDDPKKKDDPNNGKVGFTCQIRHLTEGTTKYYTYDENGKKIEHEKKTYGKDKHMAYIFRVQQIDELDFSFCAADIDLSQTKDQTYFVVAAEQKTEGGQTKTTTHVELALAGDITIAPGWSAHKKLRELSEKLPIDLKIPGIHFAKLRLANFPRSEWDSEDNMIKKFASDLVDKRDAAEKEWESSNKKLVTVVNSKEIEINKECYLDLGEWSLASPAKKIGPFDLNLKNFNFSFDSGQKKMVVGIEGEIGLCGNKVHATAGVDITSKLNIPSDITNFSAYSLSDPDIEFKKIELDCDFSVLKLKGGLEAKNQGGNKGYHGDLNIEIIGLFGVKCTGGYFNHTVSENDDATMALIEADAKADNPSVEFNKEDRNYSWGYFTLEIESGAGIQIPPVAITRIAGGFYFNCRPGFDEKSGKYLTPEEGVYGLIGVSLGLGMASSAGEHVLNANVDLNVVYNRKANNGKGALSTFLFKGTCQAVSGIIDAKVQLLYQNDDTDKFLSLDITLDAGLDAGGVLEGAVGKYMAAANAELEQIKDQLDTFQDNLSSKVKDFKADGLAGLENSPLKSDYSEKSEERDKEAEDVNKQAAATADSSEKAGAAVAKTHISLQVKVTWKAKGVTLPTPLWHVYLGEPDEKKRCEFKLIDFKSKIVNVDIGANGYVCVGNELPNNGQLPPIPTEISNFLYGSSGEVTTNADKGKADRSRKAAAEAMLGTPLGGVMVGARAWGFIDVDLGLFYGYLKAIAGFDMSMIKYDDSNAYCTNLNRRMGYNGWYARGQFYAYLAAKFGLHILIPHLIDRKIDLIDAAIGGLFEAGLPSPTWVKGTARVKVKLLGGLIDINKKFEFEAGQYCEQFYGNALDDFSLFGDCNIGYGNYIDGWKKDNAITVGQAKSAYITTEASLNSQYRLVDPSTQKALEDKSGVEADKLKLQASRTYVFDFDKSLNNVDGLSCVNGVRLIEMSPNNANMFINHANSGPYTFIWADKKLDWMEDSKNTSMEHESGELNSKYKGPYYDHTLNGDCLQGIINTLKNVNNLEWDSKEKFDNSIREVPVRIVEGRGSKFHFNMPLQPDKCYLLILTGNGYEVEAGQRQWCEIVEENSKGKLEPKWMEWQQTKFIYFNTLADENIKVKTPRPDVEDLQPYVALAYPSAEGSLLTNTIDDGDVAYTDDILNPVIALNTNLEGKIYNDKDSWLYWQLETRKVGETQWNQPSQTYSYIDPNTNQSGTNSGPLWQTQTAKMVNENNSFSITVPRKFSLYIPQGASSEHLEGLEHNLKLCYKYPIEYTEQKVKNYKWSDHIVNLNTSPSSEIWKFYKYLMMKADIWKDCPFKDGKFTTDQEYSAACLFGLMWISQEPSRKETFEHHLNQHANEMEDITLHRDTTIYVANWYFRGADHAGPMNTWRNKGGSGKNNYEELLPYERAFTGVRPQSAPAYDYDDAYLQYRAAPGVIDKVDAFRNATQFRLQDPYMYFAYLSNYVFVGGQRLKSYSFDDIETRHASETLTFTYNGVDVQGSAYISGLEGKLMTIRDSMYMAYNEWNYNNKSLHFYPLPEGQGEDFDKTRSQQDSRVAPYHPAYDPSHPSYPYAYGAHKAVAKFVAPYMIAEKLSEKLEEIAKDIYGRWDKWERTGGNMYEADRHIKMFNNLHRGEYLTLSCEGFEVRVPYYQFPLIFGDCFGSGDENYDHVSRSNRTFAFSVDGDTPMRQTTRWKSFMSNIMFFRFFGGIPLRITDDADYGKNYVDYVVASNKPKVKYVEKDLFSAAKALQNVSSLSMMAYRVNSFDYVNNLYWLNQRGNDYGWFNLFSDKESYAKSNSVGYLLEHATEVKVGSSVPDLDSKDKEKK